MDFEKPPEGEMTQERKDALARARAAQKRTGEERGWQSEDSNEGGQKEPDLTGDLEKHLEKDLKEPFEE